MADRQVHLTPNDVHGPRGGASGMGDTATNGGSGDDGPFGGFFADLGEQDLNRAVRIAELLAGADSTQGTNTQNMTPAEREQLARQVAALRDGGGGRSSMLLSGLVGAAFGAGLMYFANQPSARRNDGEQVASPNEDVLQPTPTE